MTTLPHAPSTTHLCLPLHAVALLALTLALGLGGCGHGGQGDSSANVPPPVDESDVEGEGGGQDRAQSCGSRGMAACAEGEFCLFPDDAECGATDRPGRCEPTPQACTREYRPVCGCDGRTYGNRCTASAAGTSVAREGECAQEPTGEAASDCVRGGCGGELCRGADEEAMATICVARPEHACYREAACERQADGRCGFTPSPQLSACLANPPAL